MDVFSSICEELIFRKVHKELGTRLNNFLYYKYGDLEKAKDITQESFMRLWKNCEKLSYDKAKSFLYTVANRLFLDDASHQKVKLKFQYRSEKREAYYESNPEFVYREEEFKAQLEEAINQLPDQQKTVFLMSRIDKMKNKEVAEALGLSIKTVEKHIAGALKTLKSQLDELKNTKL